MSDYLLKSSHRDDSNKWSNIGFGQETKELAAIEINFTHLIWSSALIRRLLSLEKKWKKTDSCEQYRLTSDQCCTISLMEMFDINSLPANGTF